MQNISLIEVRRLLPSCSAIVISTSIVAYVIASSQPVRWRWVYDHINDRAPSSFCMYTFCCGQVMERCACSGRYCVLLKTYLWAICGNEKILDNSRSGSETKMCVWKYSHTFIGVF